MSHFKHNYLIDFISGLQSKGRYTFNLPELRSVFNVGTEALKQSVRRLVSKKIIYSFRRNFYSVIPPEYRALGIVPPMLFIDDLMHSIGKQYYIGLLSAAALHGAAHQQPQEFFVVTVKPALRRLAIKGTIVNFVVRDNIDPSFLIQKQTERGYLTVSNAELTALDCVFFQNRIGGINRTADIINELVPAMTQRGLRKFAKAGFPLPSLQRLGFLLDLHRGNNPLANALFEVVGQHKIRKVLLSPSAGKSRLLSVSRWKIIENVNVEPE